MASPSYRWIFPVAIVGSLALLIVPYIMWKYVAARNLHGEETYSNVHYLPEVKGNAGTELHLAFTGTKVTAVLADFDGTPQIIRTFMQGTADGRLLQLKGNGPLGPVEITGRAEGAVFDGQITRRLDLKSDPVQHPLLLKRVPAPGQTIADDE
ncbi:MAG TPA: hypothetical protein VMZ25_02160 [Terriglobales bacterium]|nr:hypothetical protein [Terriglobales bacterium]